MAAEEQQQLALAQAEQERQAMEAEEERRREEASYLQRVVLSSVPRDCVVQVEVARSIFNESTRKEKQRRECGLRRRSSCSVRGPRQRKNSDV